MQGSNANVIFDELGRGIVIINDIRFVGRQNINWNDVEVYLKDYINTNYEVLDSADVIYIGSDAPSEIKGSEDTRRLKGTYAKAKANAVTELPLLIQYAGNKRWQENYKLKHGTDAGFGWYRFTTRFAMPVYDNDGDLLRYNIFRIEMLVRHSSDGRLYLYDLVNVKKEKEAGTPSGQ